MESDGEEAGSGREARMKLKGSREGRGGQLTRYQKGRENTKDAMKDKNKRNHGPEEEKEFQ